MTDGRERLDVVAPTPYRRRMQQLNSRAASVRVTRAALGALAVLAVLAASCGAADDAMVKVRMYDNAFSPVTNRIPVGASVTFANVGRNPHNAVAADGRKWSTEQPYGELSMPAGASAAVRFDTAGVYRYYCTYHGTPDGRGMAGRLLVGSVADSASTLARVAPVSKASGTVRRVPAQYPTIQSAVDAAAPGDLVLVSPGTYREEVTITTPSVVLRGLDRNTTIVDGEFLRGNGVVALADGVAIENLTARHAILNGFYWTGVKGWRGSYLTASNNGDYGIYAFDSPDGVFEHSYASGSPDAGFYVGQCRPCQAVLHHVTAENNALGYSGTNASGVVIASSTFRRNRAGVVPNTLDTELLPPQGETRIVANLIADNGNWSAPTLALEAAGWGNGVLLVGGERNIVERNVITGHPLHGVLVSPMIDRYYWTARGNIVRDNVIAGSGRADVAVGGPWSSDNCASRNGDGPQAPALLSVLAACDRWRLPMGLDLVPAIAMYWRGERAKRGDVRGGDWRTQPPPPPQANMPDAATAPARPAWNVFTTLAFNADTAQLPPGTVQDARTLAPAPFSLARLVWGGSAMWWRVAIPLWGLVMLVRHWRAGRRGRGVATLLGAIAVMMPLAVAGGWWYGVRGG